MTVKPKLKSVIKRKAPYPLNNFPSDFGEKLGKEIIFILSTRSTPRLEGNDWEEIFANLIGAEWKSSNVGLDDVALNQNAWCAKTVQNANPNRIGVIRLISGRNSLKYSYGDTDLSQLEPNEIGEKILKIWNTRVKDAKRTHPDLRTVVLIRSNKLRNFVVFEQETQVYAPSKYVWQWNEQDNLEGYTKGRKPVHKFTWQEHGSQFTIIQEVPQKKLGIEITLEPPTLSQETLLSNINFKPSWIKVTQFPIAESGKKR